MSGSVDFTIDTGADWGVQFTWNDANGNPIAFTSPIMNIRRELTTQSTLIAKLDESGQWDGKLSLPSPGVLVARMTADQTDNLKQGYGFWDIFVTVGGSRVKFVFGTIAIAPHVTDVSNV